MIKRELISKGITKFAGLNDSELYALYESIEKPAPFDVNKELEIAVKEKQPVKKEVKKSIQPTKKTPQNKKDKLMELIDDLSDSIDENRVVELINQHATVQHTHIIQAFDKPSIKLAHCHSAFGDVIETLQLATVTNCGWPYLVGPAGSGKTTLAKQIAEALSVEFYAVESLSDKFELTGFMDANQNYCETTFYKCFKKGGVFLMDEIDRSAADAVIAFNMALANGFFTFPNGERVERHTECYFIAGGNTNGTGPTTDYSTAQVLDGSTRDRFMFITIDYDSVLEQRLAIETALSFNPDYDHGMIDLWYGLVIKAREFVKTNRMDVIVSPRKTITGAAMIARGATLDVVIKKVFTDFSDQQLTAMAA